MISLGVLFALPWGVLADKRSRRLVAFLCILGVLLNELWYLVIGQSFHSSGKVNLSRL